MPAFRIENQIHDPVEQTPRGKLMELQLARFRQAVERASHVPFYKEAFRRAGLGPDSVRSLDDVRRFPFTTKDDMRENYPLGLLAVERARVARVHGSSGTTGKPTFVAYTANDLKLWADLCARFLVAGGLRPEHMVQISFGYGLFTGGFGLHQGVERVGASIVPAASGNTSRQVMLMQDLGADVLICTPSYALTIAEAVRAQGISPADLRLKFGHFGAEPWTEDMRVRIEQELGIVAFNNYGLSEIIGPGVSGECAAQCGMHLQEDHFLIECLDPQTLEPVPTGQRGELVITAMTKEAMPIIRYRTRDIASLDDAPCACGRTTARMSRVVGRSDDMLIIRGVNVFPSQIETALLRIEGTAPHYLIEVDRPSTLDRVVVKVELRPQDFSDRFSDMQSLRGRIEREIQNVTGIHATVELVEPQTLERSVGKCKRVIDHRAKDLAV